MNQIHKIFTENFTTWSQTCTRKCKTTELEGKISSIYIEGCNIMFLILQIDFQKPMQFWNYEFEIWDVKRSEKVDDF